jgi:hypothetical protein
MFPSFALYTSLDWLGRHLAVSTGRSHCDRRPCHLPRSRTIPYCAAFRLARSSLRRNAVVYRKLGLRLAAELCGMQWDVSPKGGHRSTKPESNLAFPSASTLRHFLVGVPITEFDAGRSATRRNGCKVSCRPGIAEHRSNCSSRRTTRANNHLPQRRTKKKCLRNCQSQW